MPDEPTARLARLESQIAQLRTEMDTNVRALSKELRDNRHSVWRQISELNFDIYLVDARRRMDRVFDALQERFSKRRKQKRGTNEASGGQP